MKQKKMKALLITKFGEPLPFHSYQEIVAKVEQFKLCEFLTRKDKFSEVIPLLIDKKIEHFSLDPEFPHIRNHVYSMHHFLTEDVMNKIDTQSGKRFVCELTKILSVIIESELLIPHEEIEMYLIKCNNHRFHNGSWKCEM